MPGLYLHCAICSRKQAEGLISGAAWGRLELPPDANADERPAGATVRVCPWCISTHSDWKSLALGDLRQAS